jgi:hypothetical protein
MRLTLATTVVAFAIGMAAMPVFAQCEDKSQQNAADEAVVKGDLDAASKCATEDDVDRIREQVGERCRKS